MTCTTHLGVCSLLCLAPLLFGSPSAEPTQRVLHGTVRDTSQNILPGVTVDVKGTEATYSLIIAFCESCMRTRLPDGVLTGETALKPASIASGWLAGQYDRAAGGMQELSIAPYAAFPGDRAIANWLPDEAFAKVWQHYAATGKP